MKANESPYREIRVIATGLKLDAATGIGGIPFRKISECYGPFSVGKTTLALAVVSAAQKEDIQCLWADVEWAFDEQYATRLGVDCSSLDLIQEQVAEETLDQILKYAEDNKDCLIVVDAVGAIHPRVEAERASDSKTIGTQAKLVATFCRRVVPLLAINNHALLVLNHSFKDVMTGAHKTSGGEKLAYHKSLSISLKQKYGVAVTRASDGAKVGVVIEAEIMKNKLAATVGTKVELMMIPGSGFSKEHDRLQAMIDAGNVVKKGRFYQFRGERVAGSAKEAREWVKTL